jgi:hypothetical protein
MQIYYDDQIYESQEDPAFRNLVLERIDEWWENHAERIARREGWETGSIAEARDFVSSYRKSHGSFDNIPEFETSYQLPDGKPGRAYTARIRAEAPPFTKWEGIAFKAAEDELPPGIQLSEEGIFTGKPVTSGDWEVTVYARARTESGIDYSNFAAKGFLIVVKDE